MQTSQPSLIRAQIKLKCYDESQWCNKKYASGGLMHQKKSERFLSKNK